MMKEGLRNYLQEKVEVPLLSWLLNLPYGSRILEIGCGRGNALPAISKQCKPIHLVGMDFDGQLVASAENRTRLKGIQAEFYHADVRSLSFPNESFDVIIDFGTCYYLSDPEKALREIERVLKTGGLFVHETPVAQFIAHPIRSSWHSLPWHATPHLIYKRNALLWASKKKIS